MSAVKRSLPKFRTQFERQRKQTNPGSRYEITYKPHFSETGAVDLVEDGKIDVYDQIQSFRESCDINTILARFANGDISALNKGLPYFADVSEMPKTLAGFLQLYADAETAFSKFPADLRELFNNNAAEFFATLDTNEFSQRMGNYMAAHPVAPTPTDANKEVSADVPQSE